MKIKTYGAMGATCQLPRINEAFKKLGHVLVDDPKEADLIYSNDRTFEDWGSLYMRRAFKIANVLDIPTHLFPNINLEKWRGNLDPNVVDMVTSISKSTQKNVKEHLGIDSEVIYNPIMEVYKEDQEKDLSFLYVGRCNDPNKRFELVFKVVSCLGGQLNVIGNEIPFCGNYLGYVPLETLNEVYNRSEFTFLPSKVEGIGLPMIEAIICGSFPLCCVDNEAAKEFLPHSWLAEPSPEALMAKIAWVRENREEIDKKMLDLAAVFRHQFDPIVIAKNILRFVP